MEIPGFLQTRLNNLEQNLNDGAEIVSELDQALTLAEGPLAKRRYQADIEHVTKLVKQWEIEYSELVQRIHNLAPTDAKATKALDEVGDKLGSLQQSVVQIINTQNYNNITQTGGTLNTGNNSNYTFSGNFTNSNLNAGSTLTNVQQTINNLSNTSPADKAELDRLVKQLQAELVKTPPSYGEDVQAIADTIEDIVKELGKEQPRQRIIKNRSEELKEAANDLKEAAPSVLTLSEQLVSKILDVLH